MTLKDLTELKFNRDRQSRPNIPLYAIPRTAFTDKTANGLTKAIQAYCDIKGIMCIRSGNEGRYRPGASYVDVIGRAHVMKGKWLPGLNNGQADLTIVVNGKYIAIEVKIGKDRQSEDQKAFESKVEGSGGRYVIVKSWTEFISYTLTIPIP